MRKLFSFLLILSLISCEEEQFRYEIPLVFVNEEINLNTQEYLHLRVVGNYSYINAGYRGIILLRQSQSQFVAFERACTFESRNPDSVVEFDESDLFIVDPSCGSQFNRDGEAFNGPAVLPLMRYRVRLDGNFLTIFSDF